MKYKIYYQFFGSCFLLLFFFLGYVVKFYPDWLNPFDNYLTSLIRTQYPVMNDFFLWVTKFANVPTIIILFLVCLILLIKNKKYVESIWLSANLILVSVVINSLLKIFFSRERPILPHLVSEHSKSFPSGHAVTSVIFYGTIILLLSEFILNKRICVGIQIFLGGFILLIGCSRVYLGVHFPSDIVAGFSLGLAWLLFTYPVFLEQRFIWYFKHKQG